MPNASPRLPPGTLRCAALPASFLQRLHLLEFSWPAGLQRSLQHYPVQTNTICSVWYTRV